jgi:hypothetical protein
MDAPDNAHAAVDERRRAIRRSSNAHISVSLETGHFGGEAEDLSAAGVFFFSPDRVRVRVEITENGRVTVYGGRLVRMEPVSQSSSGFAIEFDRT